MLFLCEGTIKQWKTSLWCWCSLCSPINIKNNEQEEPTTSYKWTQLNLIVWSSIFKKKINCFRQTCGICLKLLKENQKITQHVTSWLGNIGSGPDWKGGGGWTLQTRMDETVIKMVYFIWVPFLLGKKPGPLAHQSGVYVSSVKPSAVLGEPLVGWTT